MLPYAIVGFLSAFLLFQVQPVIAKVILPWFGGSSSVWTTCMLFFQMLLLGGYLYSHWLHRKLALRGQAIAHSILLTASLLALPILPNTSWKPSPADDPLLRILAVLAVSVGLPYFLLSTTSPLLQAWYSRTHKGAVPYRLFALSNAGSLLALLTYPILVEPLLSTRHQGQIWSAAYVLFAASCAWIAWNTVRRAPAQGPAGEEQAQGEAGAPPSAGQRLLWLLLAACASILLLSATTFLTQDVAAIPFLWILPLSVYLVSFILCFDAPRYYNRAVFLPLLLLGLGAMAYLHHQALPGSWMVQAVALVTVSLFVFCMVCHGELARRKPHPRYLTDFYVMVSVGGACGGLFVGIASPLIFNAYYEFPLGLTLCASLAAFVILRDRAAWFRRGHRWVLGALIVALVPAYLFGLGFAMRKNLERSRALVRNFYGQMRVYDLARKGTEPHRILVHGQINHGYQFFKKYRREPVSYFCPDTGIGRALLDRKPGVPIRIGILGLGIGTLAAYGREGDTIRIYEINPEVVNLANREFTYLKDTPAKVEVVLGDGRLSLEREPPQQFDVLVMDAFSGDSVPVHLVTREAFGIYFRHLRPGGILALNCSNRHLDLGPVMEQNASYYGKAAWWFDFEEDEEDPDERCYGAAWTLIVDQSRQGPEGRLYQIGRRLVPDKPFRAWTDDFSNLYAILK